MQILRFKAYIVHQNDNSIRVGLDPNATISRYLY